MKNTIHSIIIGASIVITAVILAGAFKNRNRSNDVIAVTGLGSKDFVSDLIVWNGSFSQKSIELKAAYSQLDKDRESIKKYLLSKGLKENNIVFSSVDILKEYDESFNDRGEKTKSIFTGYKLNQSIQVESKEVDKVENISREVSELINNGIELYSNAPQYYYTNLAALKVEMIAQATLDARGRAEKIASNAGSSLGRLKKAEMGVFQIVAQNSSEEYSWGGSFNTSSKRKTANITVKLQYESN